MSTTLQTRFAVGVGAVFLILGIGRLLYLGPLFGLFSISGIHGTLHMLYGALYLATGLKRKKETAFALNMFLGWTLLAVAALNLVFAVSGTPGLVPDVLLHGFAGSLSVLVGYQGKPKDPEGEDWMRANNWPMGK